MTLATHRPAEVVLGHLGALADEWGINARVEMAGVENLAEGKSGVIRTHNDEIGIVGQPTAEIITAYGLKQPVWILDLDFDLIKKLAVKTVALKPPPKYSAITEDITLTLPSKAMLGPIIETMKKKSTLVQSVKVVDKWENTVTLRVEFNSEDKQLTQADVNSQKEILFGLLGENFGV